MSTASSHTEDHTELARTVAEIRQFKYTTVPNVKYPSQKEGYDAMMASHSLRGWGEEFELTRAPLVDATFVYRTWVEKVGPEADVLVSEFPSVKPPWPTSFIGYMNGYGVPYVNCVMALEVDETTTGKPLDVDGKPMESCRWVVHVLTFAGLWGVDVGSSPVVADVFGARPINVLGPLHTTRVFIAEDGGVINARLMPMVHTDLDDDIGKWPLITVLATFSLLNSTNCSIAESPITRPLRRTEQRYGVRSHVIQVTTKNRSARSSRAGEPSSITYPLTSVRGHHAHYGDCCPRFHEPKGLLFGKLTGRVWVPQYARGDESVGHVDQTFMMGASA